MQAPTVQESLQTHTPEATVSSVVNLTHPNSEIEGWRDTWFLKHEDNEVAGCLFDSEVFREGSD